MCSAAPKRSDRRHSQVQLGDTSEPDLAPSTARLAELRPGVRTQRALFDDSAKERLTEAQVRFRDLGMTKIPKVHELESVVEGYPDAIRYRAVGEK